MEKNTILMKAKRLFIGAEKYSDEDLLMYYNLAKDITPITDYSVAEIVLEELERVVFTTLTELGRKFVRIYYTYPKDHDAFSKDEMDVVKSAQLIILVRKNLFYIPEIRRKKQMDYKIIEFDDFGLSRHAILMLNRGGITAERLLTVTEKEVLAVRNVGTKCAAEIMAKRDEYLKKNKINI